MTPPVLTARLLEAQSPRDIAILESLETYRLLTSPQLRRLHFDPSHTSQVSATRSTNRVMARLEADGMVARLEQRIGGTGGGSASLVWQLGPTGEAVLRLRSGRRQRRRYVEPSGLFTRHTLAVADVAIGLVEAARTGRLELLVLETEPACWRRFLGRSGLAETLKPDLYVVTANTDYEAHSFVEVDLDTEHRPQLLAKAAAYQRYQATGRHQAEHGTFPAVVWITPNAHRCSTIQDAITGDHRLDPNLFRYVTANAPLAPLYP